MGTHRACWSSTDDIGIFRVNSLNGILWDMTFEYTILSRSSVFRRENNKTFQPPEDVWSHPC